MPVVSVLMAVKNSEAIVQRAITSILNQTFTDFEFLIVDDFSTDDTPSILAELNDKRVTILKATQPGLVNALNHGLEQTTGKYIARMDADDESFPDRFEEQVKLLDNENDIGVVSGLVNHISTTEKQEGYATHVQLINKIISPEEHFANRFRDAPLANPSAMFRRSLLTFGNYKSFEGPEDYEFWLRLMQNGVLFKKINKPVLKWYDYTNRLTRTNYNYSTDAFSKTKAEYFALWWKTNSQGRELWIWGYGKDVFNKSKWLEEYGIEIAGFVDVKNRPKATRKVIKYTELELKEVFTLVYVSNREGQKQIGDWLQKKKLKPVTNFYFMT